MPHVDYHLQVSQDAQGNPIVEYQYPPVDELELLRAEIEKEMVRRGIPERTAKIVGRVGYTNVMQKLGAHKTLELPAQTVS